MQATNQELDLEVICHENLLVKNKFSLIKKNLGSQESVKADEFSHNFSVAIIDDQYRKGFSLKNTHLHLNHYDFSIAWSLIDWYNQNLNFETFTTEQHVNIFH